MARPAGSTRERPRLAAAIARGKHHARRHEHQARQRQQELVHGDVSKHLLGDDRALLSQLPEQVDADHHEQDVDVVALEYRRGRGPGGALALPRYVHSRSLDGGGHHSHEAQDSAQGAHQVGGRGEGHLEPLSAGEVREGRGQTEEARDGGGQERASRHRHDHDGESLEREDRKHLGGGRSPAAKQGDLVAPLLDGKCRERHHVVEDDYADEDHYD